MKFKLSGNVLVAILLAVGLFGNKLGIDSKLQKYALYAALAIAGFNAFKEMKG